MNLLPKTEKDNLKKGLKLRFFALALFLLSACFLAGFVMLLPSYFLATSHVPQIVSAGFSESGDNELVEKMLNLPSEIDTKLDFFVLNTAGISVPDFFSKIVGYLPESVKLNSVSFEKNTDYKGETGTIFLVSGIAANRDSLVLFSTDLKDSNLFSDIEMPVSALAKDKNIPFSMSIFIKN